MLLIVNRTIRRKFIRLWTSYVQESGSSLSELALVIPFFLFILLVLVDLGQAYYYAISISSAAHAAAIYGVQNPTDVNGMISAASANAPDIKSLSTNVSYGCECHDGSSVVADCSAPPACSDNYVNFVAVTTTATFTPIVPYPGIPASLTLTGSARLRSGGD